MRRLSAGRTSDRCRPAVAAGRPAAPRWATRHPGSGSRVTTRGGLMRSSRARTRADGQRDVQRGIGGPALENPEQHGDGSCADRGRTTGIRRPWPAPRSRNRRARTSDAATGSTAIEATVSEAPASDSAPNVSAAASSATASGSRRGRPVNTSAERRRHHEQHGDQQQLDRVGDRVGEVGDDHRLAGDQVGLAVLQAPLRHRHRAGGSGRSCASRCDSLSPARMRTDTSAASRLGNR